MENDARQNSFTSGEISTALLKIIDMWIAGTFEQDSPTSSCSILVPTVREYILCRKKLLESQEDEDLIECSSASPSAVQEDGLQDYLLKHNVLQHFSQVMVHRSWIRHVYNLLVLCSAVKDTQSMNTRLQEHDLTKYTPREALGYAIKFGVSGLPRTLLDPAEEDCWQTAWKHHWSGNSHHPEYFREFNRHMDDDDLIESIIDMLSRHLEKWNANESKKHAIEVREIFAMEEKYLERYTPQDRENVGALLGQWERALGKFFRERDFGHLQKWKKECGMHIILSVRANTPKKK